jgi:hypothetical protein
MLHVTESKSKGLIISIQVAMPTQKVVLEAILNSARCNYSSLQNDPHHIHYTIDSKEAGRVKTLLNGWHQVMGNLQYAVDTRNHTP